MIVLDASAVLALMNKEPGWDVVARAATNQDSTISSVNYAEVLQKAACLGVAAEIVDSVIDGQIQVAVEVGQLPPTPAAGGRPGGEAVAGLPAGELDRQDRQPIGGLHAGAGVVDGQWEGLAGDVDELAHAEPDVVFQGAFNVRAGARPTPARKGQIHLDEDDEQQQQQREQVGGLAVVPTGGRLVDLVGEAHDHDDLPGLKCGVWLCRGWNSVPRGSRRGQGSRCRRPAAAPRPPLTATSWWVPQLHS
jgi:hypothetical protein